MHCQWVYCSLCVISYFHKKCVICMGLLCVVQDDPSGGQPKWIPVIKTETRSNNLNPVWEPIAVKATTLNNGDVYR